MERILTITFFLIFSLSLSAQQQQQQNPCSSPGYDQFDFWIGEWEVFNASDGKKVGTNHVKQILGNCIIEENWTGTGISRGKSFNSYQPATKTWKQVWVDNGGSMLIFEGRREGNQMKLEMEQQLPGGEKQMDRLYFTWDEEKQEVRQTWTRSNDGENWQTLFDAFYRKK